MLSNVPYTQPAPQDWSDLRYTFAGDPQSQIAQMLQGTASRAMFGEKGAAMQPWATGQGVPPGLLNYQIPGGPAANLTYSGAQPSLFDPITTTENGNGTTTDTTKLQDWQKAGWDYSSGSPVYKATGWDSALDWYRGLYGGDPDFVNPFVQSYDMPNGSVTGSKLTNIEN
jgi:hypothetical protein